MQKSIYCACCQEDSQCSLVTGEKIYPHRSDLSHLRFWECSRCFGYVGSHRKTNEPLGIIATKEMKELRIQIHEIIDPIWEDGIQTRSEIYEEMSKALDVPEYHTGSLRTMEEHEKALETAKILGSEIIRSYVWGGL